MKKFAAEGVGTFFLTAVIGITADPISIGLLLTALIYIAIHVCDSHFNPAISLAAWIGGRIDTSELGVYISGQFFGAVTGGAFVWWISKLTYGPAPDQATLPYEFILIEILFSFLFILLFLCMIYPARRRRNPLFGAIIGIGLAGCYLVTAPISGTGLNPAMSSGFILFDYINNGSSYQHLPVYLLAPGVGAIAAAYAHKFLMGDQA
ncbi:MAG: aquaporin [Balneolaceae bacterium]